MKHLLNILFFILITNSIQSQQVDLNTFSNQQTNPDFSASSASSLYSLVQGDYNFTTEMYDTLYFGEGAIDMIAELDLNHIRFPGGTLSQFYHYNGQNGYGSVSEDLFCRPGYLPLGNFYTKVSNDSRYPENFIHQYVDLIKALEVEQNKTIGTFYVLNIMTHFFNGDFFDINPYIDTLITTHGSSISNLLDKNPSELTDQNVEDIATVMVNVTNDPIVINLMQYLTNQTGFQEHFTENIDAIQFLIDNNISIKGIEMGNENYAFKMLHDDDLSHTPFDCTTPDSILIQYSDHFLPVKVYMQGVIKYAMITSMYDKVISELWDIETGIVINAIDYGVNVLDIDEFEILNYEGEKGRYYQIWNKYLGQLDTYDAVIPHIYLKALPQCEIYDLLSEDSLSTFIKNRIDFYFKDLIPWQFDILSADTEGKKMWITEWNINGANAFANTFSHATHTYKFLNEINALQFEYNIEHINYHVLMAWNFNQFALIRAAPTTSGTYGVNKQAMFHAFEYMKSLHGEATPIAYSNYSDWPANENNSLDHSFWGYVNEDNTIYHLNYINQSSEAIEIDLDDLIFNIYKDSLIQENKMVNSYTNRHFDAESVLSSNLGCVDYPEIFSDYQLLETAGIQGTSSEKTITLPPFSFGNVEMNLGEVVISSLFQNELIDFSIYPNPANEVIQVQISQSVSNFNAEIIDVAGSLHYRENINTSNFKINVESLASGIYILQLKDEDNQILGREKLIVSHK